MQVQERDLFFSIVISGNHWSQILHTLKTVLDHAGDCLFELILVSSIRQPGEGIASLPNLNILIVENADIFRLRLEAIKYCTGNWVILLEDHNEIKSAWLRSLSTHIQENPTSLAFVTSLKNGSADTPIDQANFLFNFCDYLPEARHLSLKRHPVIAGACFKRNVLRDLDQIKEGELELKILPRLYQEGRTVFVHDVSIIHIQSNSVDSTLLNHYYNAKACAGLLKKMNYDQIDIFALKQSIKAPLFFYRKWTQDPYRLILKQGYQRCLPYLICIGLVYGIGSTLGWLLGKGNSASNLE